MSDPNFNKSDSGVSYFLVGFSVPLVISLEMQNRVYPVLESTYSDNLCVAS